MVTRPPLSPAVRGRRDQPRRQPGQMIVLFALTLMAIIAMAALLVDGGMAWANRREAQAAADTAALAAAQAIVGGANATTAAQAIAAANGIPASMTDCTGKPAAGVVVNRPPSTGAHSAANDPTGANNYIEVITTRALHTTFASAVGQGCWMVSARSVAAIGTSSVAKCSFCSLNDSNTHHTLVLKNGATLRVDGDIYVNSTNGGATGACPLDKWNVCGDGFDVFGAGGFISAQTISVAGGWETHDNNPVKADGLAPGCGIHPDPPSQTAPYLPADVCIHMPQIADPLNDPATPKNVIPAPTRLGAPVAGQNGCPAGSLVPTGTLTNPSTLTISAGSATICPGTYFGGIRVTGGTVTMAAGTYYIAGGGFTVLNAANIVGTSGVMIYNSSGTATNDSNPGVDLVPPKKKGFKDPVLAKNGGLTASPSKNWTIGMTVTLTFEIERNKAGDPLPTGTIDFYDGQNLITGCADVPVSPGSNGNAVRATCTTSWSTFGTKSVSSVYSGDTTYNAIGDTITITIPAPAGAQVAPIDIDTTGSVKLSGPTSGLYKGLTVFQDRSSSLTITLSPGGGVACPAGFMTTGVPNGTAPAPCGALGGLQGTIYAANDNALVYITASGLANLQVIAGKIQIDSDADARFAYTPQFFANGNIRLVE